MKKLLVTGISGFLGWHVAGYRQRDWKIIGLYNRKAFSSGRVTAYSIDFLQTDRLWQVIRDIEPDAILHLAAISSPAVCEKQVDHSYRINVVVPTLLAEYCRTQRIPFVFTSSDMVFDGQHAPYGPYDYTRPISIYGKEKAEAEDRVLTVYREATIARLPLLYGLTPGGTNFMQQWLRNWSKGQTVQAFTDEIRSAVSATDAVRGLFMLLNKRLAHIWHLGGLQAVSRFTFAQALAQSFSFSSELITPLTLAEAGQSGKRPPDLSLNSQLTYDHGYYPAPLHQALREWQKVIY